MSRLGRPWTINECLQLEREFELLQLPLSEIATLHKRTIHAIMYKLDKEEMCSYDTSYHTLSRKEKNSLGMKV